MVTGKERSSHSGKAGKTQISPQTDGLAVSELRYRRLFESAKDGILILDAKTGLITDSNPFIEELTGFSHKDLQGKSLWQIGLVHDIAKSETAMRKLLRHGYVRFDNLPLGGKTGELIQVEFISNVYNEGKKKVIQCNIRDNTTKANQAKKIKQYIEEITLSEERFRGVMEAAPDAIFLMDARHQIVFVNTKAVKLLGYSKRELLGQKIDLLIPAGFKTAHKKQVKQFLSSPQPRAMGAGLRLAAQTKSGAKINVDIALSPFSMEGETTVMVTMHDITEQLQTERQIQKQLEHLRALTTIDNIILAQQGLETSFALILDQVAEELQIDAAAILVKYPGTKTAHLTSTYGFRHSVPVSRVAAISSSLVEKIVSRRRMVTVSSLKGKSSDPDLSGFFEDEGFECFFGVPLISNRHKVGVLEIFHRSPLEPDQDWFEFLNTVAGQAAIAVSNRTLLDKLEKSNLDLSLAYDETIEGWSQALDLRDKETEGHTLRVTHLTGNIAVKFGFKSKELRYIRWGALLHDIGKMGIPDNILLKPGPLSAEEWVRMKQHPIFAHKLLAPIHFLRNALDIPYCHHEKWDGTGYPRGLKGDKIPLAARIFSVIDMFDALRSDRPYRSAWTEKKALSYIAKQGGTHFDPDVLKVVLKTLRVEAA